MPGVKDTMKLMKLRKQLQQAEAIGDEARAAEIRAQIQKIQQRAEASPKGKTILTKVS